MKGSLPHTALVGLMVLACGGGAVTDLEPPGPAGTWLYTSTVSGCQVEGVVMSITLTSPTTFVGTTDAAVFNCGGSGGTFPEQPILNGTIAGSAVEWDFGAVGANFHFGYHN